MSGVEKIYQKLIDDMKEIEKTIIAMAKELRKKGFTDNEIKVFVNILLNTLGEEK